MWVFISLTLSLSGKHPCFIAYRSYIFLFFFNLSLFSYTCPAIFPISHPYPVTLTSTGNPPHCPCTWVLYSCPFACPFPFFPPLAPSTLPSGHSQFCLIYFLVNLFLIYFNIENRCLLCLLTIVVLIYTVTDFCASKLHTLYNFIYLYLIVVLFFDIKF